jgi:WD40 repeat protein
VDANGSECLNDVFDKLNVKGMGDINALYGMILRLTHSTHMESWTFERFRRIVGCIVVLRKPLCLADIGMLLDLRKPGSNEAVNIEHHVRRLRTVLVGGTNAIDGQTVPRLYKSFYEFITSERADPCFRISLDASHETIALQCLRQLAGLGMKQDKTIPNACLPASPRYACEFWTSHLPSTMTAGVAISGSFELPELQELCRLSSPDESQPSSVDVAFTFDKKHIVSSLNDVICLWDADSGARIDSIKGHTNAVLCVAFSPDGKHIISASRDNTLRLWDARSGQLVGSPFKLEGAGYSVGFSPDGQQIVADFEDDTVRLWDTRSDQPIGSTFRGHTGRVRSVAFSPDGRQIISGLHDGTLRLWMHTVASPLVHLSRATPVV